MIHRVYKDNNEYIRASLDVVMACFVSTPSPNIALSGGSTPRLLYEELAKKHVNGTYYLVDERYVPKTDKNANYALISKTGLTLSHFFDTDLSIPVALDQYETALKQIPGNRFDLIILGIGTDGHIASLFAHTQALHETQRLVAHTQTELFPVKDRLTITFPAIMKSKKLLLLAAGENKKQIIDDLFHSKKSFDDLPAKKIMEHPNLTIHLLLV